MVKKPPSPAAVCKNMWRKMILERKTIGKARGAIGSILQDMQNTHGERERESWTRGERTEGKKKQNKRTESMLEECAQPLANPSAASFFPLFLSNSVSLFLSTFLL